jgi:hypothetical protein
MLKLNWIKGGFIAVCLHAALLLLPQTSAGMWSFMTQEVELFQLILSPLNFILPYNSPLNYLALLAIPIMVFGVPFFVGAFAVFCSKQIQQRINGRGNVSPSDQ